MLISIKRQEFESLNDVSLIWTCIEPTIQKTRGKNFTIKSEVYSQLTDGQKALFMFQILYGHTLHGVEEFYCHLSYLLSNKGMWSELKNGMNYFGANDMLLLLLDEMNTIYEDVQKEQSNVSFGEIEKDTPLFFLLRRLDASLKDILPSTIILVASYIRSNIKQFAEIID